MEKQELQGTCVVQEKQELQGTCVVQEKQELQGTCVVRGTRVMQRKQELLRTCAVQGARAVQETRMNDLHELTDELMKDPEFKKEYDALQPERDLTMSLVMARKRAGLTQAELSEKTGISQSDISRLENGSRNPTIALLNRIANALNATCRIEFVPNAR
ncbi:hypothetical protein GV51_1311 [Gardnerella vaginalis 5-1]|nr:hypothetical protein GV51_1311 [Gardnerella vaginalis 5-1]